MRIMFALALVANSLDLVATALGIHLFGNREGNPLLAGVAHQHWWLFVLLKGLFIPVLIIGLYRARRYSRALASGGLVLVTLALTVAVGQWLGWMAGVVHVGPIH